MASDILRKSAVAQTPVSRPAPGKTYQHIRHGVVEVVAVEDEAVVFTRAGGGYINNRQQPIKQFRAQTVGVR